MEYFLSHIKVIFLAGIIVAVAAVLWWYLLDKNEKLKRERAKARMEAARIAAEQNKKDSE